MIATTTFGSNQTINAGTTAALHWNEIVVDGSGTFSNGGGSGTTWDVLLPGQYQILLSVTPTAPWPNAYGSPIIMEVDLLNNFFLVDGGLFQPDGTSMTPLMTGMCSNDTALGGPPPWAMRVGLHNSTGSNITTLGQDTFLTMNRLGDAVDF